MRLLPNKDSKLEEYIPFANVDLIVTDIDGTLIMSDEPVLEQIKRCLKSLKRKGTEVTIATGRTFNGAKPLLDELNIKRGMPVVLYNGGIVLEYGTNYILAKKSISISAFSQIKECINLDKTNIFVYNFSVINNILNNGAIEGNQILEEVYGFGPNNRTKDINGLDIVWKNSEFELFFEPNAILIEKAQLSTKENELIISMVKSIEGISFTDSGSGYIELKGNSLDKGIIFEILRGQKKYVVNKILAIGDNDNDKELFQFAEISVAVANSSAMAMEYADYICNNESSSGFLDMLNVIKDAKKYHA